MKIDVTTDYDEISAKFLKRCKKLISNYLVLNLYQLAILVFQLEHNLIYDIHHHNTRNRNCFILPLSEVTILGKDKSKV